MTTKNEYMQTLVHSDTPKKNSFAQSARETMRDKKAKQQNSTNVDRNYCSKIRIVYKFMCII